MSALLPDSDSEDELPPGWEERVTCDGIVYYVNHSTKGTQWRHPRTGKKKRVTGDLPTGWEKTVSDSGKILFYDHTNKRTTYTDPRLAFAIEEKEDIMDFRQRFDGSSTAFQVLHGHDLSNKVILITGATNGIGLETAKSFAQHGAEVIISGRSDATCQAAANEILILKPTANIFKLPMNLTSLKSVKNAASIVKQHYSTIDIFILNAGVFALGWELSDDNFETTFQINHLAQFYLTLLLEPLFKKGSRIIILSSENHRYSNVTASNVSEEKLSPSAPGGFWHMMAYNNSKLCNVLFGLELFKRWGSRGIDVFSVHPGNLVNTGLTKYSCFYRFIFMLVRPFTKSLQQAASTTVYCAVAPELVGSGGSYFNNCCLCSPGRSAQDAKLAKAVWDISIDMLKRNSFLTD